MKRKILSDDELSDKQWVRAEMLKVKRHEQQQAEIAAATPFIRAFERDLTGQTKAERLEIEALAQAAVPLRLRQRYQGHMKYACGETGVRYDHEFRKIVLQRAGLWPVILPPDPKPSKAEQAEWEAMCAKDRGRREADEHTVLERRRKQRKPAALPALQSHARYHHALRDRRVCELSQNLSKAARALPRSTKTRRDH